MVARNEFGTIPLRALALTRSRRYWFPALVLVAVLFVALLGPFGLFFGASCFGLIMTLGCETQRPVFRSTRLDSVFCALLHVGATAIVWAMVGLGFMSTFRGRGFTIDFTSADYAVLGLAAGLVILASLVGTGMIVMRGGYGADRHVARNMLYMLPLPVLGYMFIESDGILSLGAALLFFSFALVWVVLVFIAWFLIVLGPKRVRKVPETSPVPAQPTFRPFGGR